MNSAGVIDRISPTLRPHRRVVMRQSWHDLLFLHWEVEAEELQKLLPPSLTVDTFEGKAYVGLVPFTMTDVRPIWSPSIPPMSNFHETNVRTYVHVDGANPGVWFFSLDAANQIAVKIARALWKLPYHFASMSLRKEGNLIRYSTTRLSPPPLPANCKVEYEVVGDVRPALPDTLEFFLAERYLLYAQSGKDLLRGQVYHTPYPLQSAIVKSLEENLVLAAGIHRAQTDPLAHYAKGVNVEVFGLARV